MNKTLTQREAARYLDVSQDTMRLLAGREIPFMYGEGRQKIFRQADLDAYRQTKAYRTLPARRRRQPQPQPEPEPEPVVDYGAPNGKPKLIEELIARGVNPAEPVEVPQKTIRKEPVDPEITNWLFGRQPANAAPRVNTAPPDPSEVVIHTENPAVVEWLKHKGITGRVMAGNLRIEDVSGKHVIGGIAPAYILAEAKSLTIIRALGVYIRGATLDELKKGARLETYNPPVRRDCIWEE